MLRKLRRKIYRKIRFKTWYRKAYYYHRKRRQIDGIIRTFKSPEQLSDKSAVRSLKRDMIRSLFRYGSYYNEYFLFGYEGRDAAYRASFITEGIRMSFYPRMNDAKNTNLLENKFLTYKYFQKMFKRDMICIRGKAQVAAATEERYRSFAEKHPDYIVKPIYAAFGRGVHLDSAKNYASPALACEAYAEKGAVLEELIDQAPEMAAIHSGSVNTLRIPTVVIKGEGGEPEVRLFHPTLRVGRSGSVIDNFSAGGITALIDPETGVVCSDGADKKGGRYAVHPDSGVAFKGFVIPRWEEAAAMVKEAALAVPGNHYCGWDLALSRERGWCMVEANCTAQMGGMQIATRTGRRWELEELISKM